MIEAPSPLLSEFEAEVVVADSELIADGVVRLTMSAADGSELPAWTPGAHLDLILRDRHGAEVVRQYSMCGSPSDRDHYQVAVLEAPDGRGGSAAVHQLRRGDRLRVRGPRNHFSLQSSPRYVFIAGGIGITPIIPMIEEAEAARRDWTLHYGGRSRASMAFAERLEKFGDRVHLVPQDEAGLLDVTSILAAPSPGTLVYCCGPEALLRAVESACEGWPANVLHVERFSPKERPAEEQDTTVRVMLQRSGKTLEVAPGETIFDAMRAAGVSVLGSCLEGICGTCEQTVLEGEVDHRDSVLDEDERAANDCIMVCVSRARTPWLVLDA